jgi:membrane-associated phospholipid phosphatase
MKRLSPQIRPHDGWIREAVSRLRILWLAKMAGTALGMIGFFLAYFWLLRHPRFPVTVMPLVAGDRLIGFHPHLLPVYCSLWLYVALAPALVRDGRELTSYALAAVALAGIGLGIFFLWPTAVPPPDAEWARQPGFALLKAADATGNACPSLHVAFAVFTACWLERLLRGMNAGRAIRALNLLWCAGILYSTVAIRQHVVLDVLAGAVLGATVAGAQLQWLRLGSRSASGTAHR